MDRTTPRANDNQPPPRSPRQPLPQERHPRGILKQQTNNNNNNLLAGNPTGGTSALSTSNPTSPNTLSPGNLNDHNNNMHFPDGSTINPTSSVRRNSSQKLQQGVDEEQVSSLATEELKTPPVNLQSNSTASGRSGLQLGNKNNNNTTNESKEGNDDDDDDDEDEEDEGGNKASVTNTTTAITTGNLLPPPSPRQPQQQQQQQQPHNRRDSGALSSKSSLKSTSTTNTQNKDNNAAAAHSSPSVVAAAIGANNLTSGKRIGGLGVAAQQQMANKKSPNSSLSNQLRTNNNSTTLGGSGGNSSNSNHHQQQQSSNPQQYPSKSNTNASSSLSQRSIATPSVYGNVSNYDTNDTNNNIYDDPNYDPNNYNAPNTYEIDDDDTMIDERAEFLGMDVDDFRALLHLAASRAQQQQQQQQHEYTSDEVNSSSGNMNRDYQQQQDYPSQSGTRFGSSAAAFVGGNQFSQRTLPNVSFNNGPGSNQGGGSNPASTRSSLVRLDAQFIPDEAAVIYLNIASPNQRNAQMLVQPSQNQFFPNNNNNQLQGLANASFGHAGSPNMTHQSGESVTSYHQHAENTFGSKLQQQQQQKKGGFKKKKTNRESVATFIREIGEGLVGRRVMWADEQQDDEDSEYETTLDDSSERDSNLDGISSLGSPTGPDRSGGGGGGGGVRGAKKQLTAKANAFSNSNTYRGTGKALVSVTTYELNGQMIMGVSRVGQWRGWLWIFAYFVYHILIEWSAAQVGTHDEKHGREVLYARAWGAVFAFVIALGFVGLSKLLKSYPKSKSRTTWSSSTNGLLLMGGCGLLFSAFEAFFWGSLHSAFPNGPLVVYPSMFLAPVVIVLLRRPFFPQRYINPSAAAPQDRIRAASTGGGSGEGRVAYPTEIACCVIVFLGGVIMNTSFPGDFIHDWLAPTALQFAAMVCASMGCVCLAVLAQRGLLRFSIIAITAFRAFGYFFLMYSDELGAFDSKTDAFTDSARVLWLSVLMGIDYILFLSCTMRSNQHLDIMAVAVVQMTTWIEVPILSIILAPSSIVDVGINHVWALWLGAAIVIAGSIGLGVFATARQSFVMYDLWKNRDLFLKPKGIKNQSKDQEQQQDNGDKK